MRVLIYATGVDTGGQGYRIGKAFAKYTEWAVDVLNNAPSVLGYPEQHVGTAAFRRVMAKRLYPLADVVHLRNDLNGWRDLDGGQGKPTVVHYHGSSFRTHHAAHARQAYAIGATQIASTIDLTLVEPDVEWLPAPYDLSELAAMRAPVGDGKVRIAHFPTDAKVKSTAVFLAATERLAERYPIEVITNVVRGKADHIQWSDVLAAKAKADIYYDQLGLGYGNNAIEAWGMGIPVVAGINEGHGRTFATPGTRAAMILRFGTIPFVEATEQTLEQTLERLIQSQAMRDEYARLGLAHVQRWHHDAIVVNQLMGIYRAAQPTHSVTLPRVSRLVRGRAA